MTAEPGTTPLIDVRTIAPFERHQRIFDMLGALSHGGSLIIVNDHDPRPLRAQIEMRHPGAYSWEYLQQGPDLWRVEISRPHTSDCGSGGH
ncbi:aminotransferase [Mesorhizobium sp. Root157]|uniref:DUF2249 domain-containing protein n=1 Tax=Mesorhizobium sp. Root157 TaxID=1736477 RepID=UPI0006F65BA8|nr:DUF2249 domain-containing protein [Mesorhizobium sp. Root157]KQZ78249.1 aminotransferase [Mesorhizobium sp. Root157]